MFRRTPVYAAAVLAAIASSYAATAASASTAGAAADTAKTRVLVKFTPTTGAGEQAAAIDQAGATEIGTVRDLGVRVLQVPSGAADRVVAALSHRADVSYAETDGTAAATQTPTDPSWGAEWGMTKVNAPGAWDQTTGSSAVTIAVIDTGVDYSQPDLQGRFVAGYDFVNNDSDPTDDNGHGTAAAGIVGATANNGIGLAGACWTCKIMPVKVLDSSGNGDYATLANGITWATDHGAQVISMSLAGSADSSTLHSAVQYAHNHGVVLVAAAGNMSTSTLYYPAAYSEVISVAGTQSNDTLYSWSDYGSWVKVAAPGCDYTTLMGGSYGSFCGTSAATPLVAGIAGLAKSLQPSATNAQIEAAIESSAVNIGSSVAYGRVDAAAALTALGSGAGSGGSGSGGTGGTTTPTTTTSTFSGSLNGKNASKSFSVTSGAGTLSASLTFSGASSMTLQLQGSSGKAITSSSSGSPVTVSSTVAAGTYKFVVSGASKTSFTLTVTAPTP